MESCICMIKGRPQLQVNGNATASMAYMTYFTENNHYKDFAEAGYKLFSVPVFFGGRGINPVSKISPFSRGIYDDRETPDYSFIDQEVRRILEAAPDALIFPRVNLMMPQWWCMENPEECNDLENESEEARESFFSEKWKTDAGNMLQQFITHIEKSDYREHIVGYQLADGKTEEWFHFDGRGSRGAAAHKKMTELYGENYSEEQWCRASSEVVAGSIDFFAGIVKQCTQNRLIVGCFYGYTLEVTDCYSGHHAMERLLESENIDFFCAPSSYMGIRTPGKDWASMTAIDSIRLHKKMFFTEYDTRTHLTTPLKMIRKNGCLSGSYEGGVWEGPKKKEVTLALLKNNAARQLTHGYGSWWFDMWGGWFAEEQIMLDLKKYHTYASEMLEKAAEEENEIAVFIDEEVYAQLPRGCEEIRLCCYESRDALGAAGVPYAIYEMGDFETVQEQYKAFLFLAPKMTNRMKKAVDYCEEHKLPYMVIDRNVVPLQTEVLRAFYRENQIHIWCESDDILYVGNGWLSIHAATAGIKKISLKDGYRIYDKEQYFEGLFEVAMKAFETKMFRVYKGKNRYFLGIDGGGTKTVFTLVDQNETMKKRIVKGSSNPNDIGMEMVKAVLAEGIQEVAADIPYNQINMFAGISGGGMTGKNKTVLQEFFEHFGFETFENGSDIENLLGLIEDKKAILVIMGTGFVVYAINGECCQRISGWGQFFDEGGSGYTIGRDGIIAALNEVDGSGTSTLLSSLLQNKLGENAALHLAEFYQKGKHYIADCAGTVFEAVRQGDYAAKIILEKNMDFAAKKIDTALQKFPKDEQKEIRIFFAGGICNEWEIVSSMIASKLRIPHGNLKRIEWEPVEGALKKAKRLRKRAPIISAQLETKQRKKDEMLNYQGSKAREDFI